MNLWRLEVLRLTRTHRWMILFGVYLFFAVTGPLTAAYFNEIMGSFGGEVTVIAPEARPIDGLAQFISNAGQLGLLALVVVGAGSLALDAKPETAAFLRTRVERPRTLLFPRYIVTTAVGTAALVAGTVVTWAITSMLIGELPAGAMLLGTALGAAFIAFAVAVLAAITGLTRSQIGAVFASLLVLLALPLLGMVQALRVWLPNELLGAVMGLVDGVPATDYLRPLLVTALTTVALLAVAVHRFERREI